MPHELDKIALGAHIDGRGTPETASHVASCEECRGYVERVKKASALFRQHGKKTPPTEKKKSSSRFEWLVITATAAFIVLASGITLKKFMPGLFSQIQGAISGAAADLTK